MILIVGKFDFIQLTAYLQRSRQAPIRQKTARNDSFLLLPCKVFFINFKYLFTILTVILLISLQFRR